jgi:hypothetical protein
MYNQIRISWNKIDKNGLLLFLAISMFLLSINNVDFLGNLVNGEAVAKETIAMNSTNSEPTLVVVGGNLRIDNEAVFKKIIDLGGGKGTKIAVMPTAASSPKKAGGLVVDTFNKYGANAYFSNSKFRM